MTKVLIAVLAVVLCAYASLARERLPPKDVVQTLSSGSAVEVRFVDGSKLRGWISDVSETGFVLSHEKKKRLEKSQVNYTEMKSLKQVKTVKPSHTTRNILIGVVIAVLAIGIAFGIMLEQTGFG